MRSVLKLRHYGTCTKDFCCCDNARKHLPRTFYWTYKSRPINLLLVNFVHYGEWCWLTWGKKDLAWYNARMSLTTHTWCNPSCHWQDKRGWSERKARKWPEGGFWDLICQCLHLSPSTASTRICSSRKSKILLWFLGLKDYRWPNIMYQGSE